MKIERMTFNIYMRLIVITVFNCLLTSLAEEVIPTISLGEIVSVVHDLTLIGRDNRHLSIRRNIISDLTAKYGCRVLSRSWGSDILLEQAISRMTLIDEASILPNMIPAADYLIKIHFADIAGKMMIEGTVSCFDIRSEKIVSTNVSFSAGSIVEVNQKVSDCIAELLSLKPRMHNEPVKNNYKAKKRVWAVLPFTFYYKPDGVGQFEYLRNVEAVLLRDKSLGKAVERTAIDNILAEHNIHEIRGDDTLTSASIAQLLKADLLLTGDVSKWDGGLRANFYVLDGRNGCIVATSSEKARDWSELNILSVNSVSNLMHSVGFLPDIRKSSFVQRNREAEELIKRNPFVRPQRYDRNWTHITLESAAIAAEGAYMLVGAENPEFVYRTMKSLIDNYYSKHQGSVFRDSILLLPSTERALTLIDTAFASISTNSDIPPTTLLRAKACLMNNIPEKAIELINLELRENPTSKDALCLKADYLFRSGKIIEADALAKKVEVDYWLKDAIQSEMTIMLERKTKEQGEIEKYNMFREIFKSADKVESYRVSSVRVDDDVKSQRYNAIWGLADAITEYLTLMRKFETPEECLLQAKQLFGSADSWKWRKVRHNHPILLHRAYCHYELGNMQEAGDICARLVESINLPAYYHYIPTRKIEKKALKLIDRIGNGYVSGNCTWKTLEQINPIPSEFKIYIIPVGIMHEQTFSEAIKHLSAYYGVDVVVMPLATTPQASIPKEGYTHLPKEMMTGLLQTINIPDDALYLGFVTDLRLISYQTFGELIGGQLAANPLLLSLGDCVRREPKPFMQLYARKLAWRIIKSFDFAHEQSNGGRWEGSKRCLDFPCIFSGAIDHKVTGANQLFRMCEVCQKKCKKYDYHKMHQNLMHYLKKSGTTIVDPSEVEYMTVKPDENREQK